MGLMVALLTDELSQSTRNWALIFLSAGIVRQDKGTHMLFMLVYSHGDALTVLGFRRTVKAFHENA
jgi:hypothetical protein